MADNPPVKQTKWFYTHRHPHTPEKKNTFKEQRNDMKERVRKSERERKKGTRKKEIRKTMEKMRKKTDTGCQHERNRSPFCLRQVHLLSNGPVYRHIYPAIHQSTCLSMWDLPTFLSAYIAISLHVGIYIYRNRYWYVCICMYVCEGAQYSGRRASVYVFVDMHAKIDQREKERRK